MIMALVVLKLLPYHLRSTRMRLCDNPAGCCSLVVAPSIYQCNENEDMGEFQCAWTKCAGWQRRYEMSRHVDCEVNISKSLVGNYRLRNYMNFRMKNGKVEFSTPFAGNEVLPFYKIVIIRKQSFLNRTYCLFWC